MKSWSGSWRAWHVLVAAALAAGSVTAPGCAPLCVCRGEHFSCSHAPLHRFPAVPAAARHVALHGARLGRLPPAALDARPLRTLVLPACNLHVIHARALASMALTLASLDLSHNEFTKLPLDALRDLRVLNWLDLQNNAIADLEPDAEWGALADSLSILSLADNQLVSLSAGALVGLRRIAQLDLEGNRLLSVPVGALPPAAVLLRLDRNLLAAPPCAALRSLPYLQALHLRGNSLRSASTSCRAVDSLDLAANELDDSFALELRLRPHLRRLILDLNSFTTIPTWVLRGGAHLQRLSMSHNLVTHISAATARTLRALERLDLDHNALQKPPDALRAIISLRHLDLSYNSLRSLNKLPPHLRILSMTGNQLDAVPRSLHELAPRTLLQLDLGYNRISVLDGTAFGAWSEALGALSLRGNTLTHLSAHIFPELLSLRELALSFNDVSQLDAGALANLTALQTLELSSTVLGDYFPTLGIKSVSWLHLDNIGIRHVAARELQSLLGLEYLDLDFNKIVQFPGEALGFNSSKLKILRLSYNHIANVQPNFLRGLPELQSVDLSYNRIREVCKSSFEDLPSLQRLSLTGNKLERLASGAFRSLPLLRSLDLSYNHLLELSAANFDHVSSFDAELTLNVSHNRITTLLGGPGAEVILTVLDLEHNLLTHIQPAFLDQIGAHVRNLRLGHNRFALLDSNALGSLPRLQLLSLDAAGLRAIRRRALLAALELAALELQHNELAVLGAEQFRGLRQLRHLRLDFNKLRVLPPDCLRDTLLEHINLADNQLALFPASALAAVGFTLRSLSLARNRLEHLDAAMFHSCAELRDLSLAGNLLTALPDNALTPLVHLSALDLSGNRLKANFGALLASASRLRRLTLAATGLRTPPALPLVELVELDLSANRLVALRETDARPALGQLRTLRLADNAFTSLRPSLWAAMPRLVELDVSGNPIVRVSSGSFDGLPRLRSLRLARLRQLEVLEPRALRPLTALAAFTLDLDGGGATLAAVLMETPSLEMLKVEMTAEELDAQLSGVRAPRLRSLEVQGAALRRVTADAFSSLGAARALTLRLRGTRVTRLPRGLAAALAGVPHLALDLRDNALEEIALNELYLKSVDRFPPAKLLQGGLVVSGNPLQCGCSAARLGAWLRRWAGEGGGGARAPRAAAGCVRRAGAAPEPLVGLEAEPCAAARASRSLSMQLLTDVLVIKITLFSLPLFGTGTLYLFSCLVAKCRVVQ